MTRVAFLGLGGMGRPMAGRLLEAGHDLAVWNRTPGRDDALVTGGAARAATPAEAARDAEVVITMLTGPSALEEVVFGPDGVASAISPAATLIDMSTVGPRPVRDAAERLAPASVLDAPVFGSVPSAEAGSLTIVVGGEPEVFERHRDLLEVMGTAVHVGPSGVGATVKLVSNAAAIATLASIGELLAMTDRTGIDEAAVLDGLALGPLSSIVERWRERFEGRYDRPDFPLALAHKDLELVLEEAEGAGVSLTMTRTAAERSAEALAAGLGDRDFGALAGFLRREP
ncbi:MAG TPA: NAD(P)-dependent oxidoreductase [Actinomycetota bacterium]|jgi:3-hydroxyisobutyrate dehydrogenase/2-hydroxy-3-oxopropionate reductase